jgi:hypothetical protein
MTELYVGWHEFHPDVSLESITSSIVGRHMTVTDAKKRLLNQRGRCNGTRTHETAP